MEAKDVINEVQQAGATIQIEGKQIAVTPLEKLSRELRDRISNNRDAVFDLLQNLINDLINMAVGKAWTLYEQRVANTEIIRVLGDTDGIVDCTRVELDGWACALALRTLQARQQIPKDWLKVANCKQCGPVWSEHNLPTLSCGWCWMRVDGLLYPQPDIKEQ